MNWRDYYAQLEQNAYRREEAARWRLVKEVQGGSAGVWDGIMRWLGGRLVTLGEALEAYAEVDAPLAS